MTLDLESEQFQTLLTDALRSGPGSPEWHQAVRTLRQQAENAPGAAAPSAIDEYTLLCTAREHLESGKSYRSVRAGPGFTRKVMEQVKTTDDNGRRRASSTGILLFLAGIVIVAAIAAGVIIFMRGSRQTENLAGISFVSPAIPEARFDEPRPPTTEPVMPAGWRAFGDLPLIIRGGGLCPNPKAGSVATSPATGQGGNEWSEENIEHRSGGIVCASPLPAEQPIDVELSFKIFNGKDFIAQAFVGDEPISVQSAGSHEVVLQIAAGEGSVFLAGRAEPDACRLPVGKPVQVRILVDRQNVIVEAGGQRLYVGPHQLGADQPRYIGVRFLRLDKPRQNARDNLLLLSVNVRKP